jgi:hypothetical protein
VLGIPLLPAWKRSPWSSDGHGVLDGSLPHQIPQDLPSDQEIAELGFLAPGGQHRRQPTPTWKTSMIQKVGHLTLVN